MEDELVNKQIALLLSTNDFHEKCKSFFDNFKGGGDDGHPYPVDWNGVTTKRISRPTQSLAQKWFREKHHIHINIILCNNGDAYGYEILKAKTNILIREGIWTTYEESLNYALINAFNYINK